MTPTFDSNENLYDSYPGSVPYPFPVTSPIKKILQFKDIYKNKPTFSVVIKEICDILQKSIPGVPTLEDIRQTSKLLCREYPNLEHIKTNNIKSKNQACYYALYGLLRKRFNNIANNKRRTLKRILRPNDSSKKLIFYFGLLF